MIGMNERACSLVLVMLHVTCFIELDENLFNEKEII